MSTTEQKEAARTPPYVSYQSFRTLLETLKSHGLPSRIDRSVLDNFSGAVGSQILTALRFLNLTDANSLPTEAFHKLHGSIGSDQWPQALADVLKIAYRPIFEIDLEKASPSLFTDKFRDAYGTEGETARKCLTFFLTAVKEAQLPVSPYIMKNKKPRSTGNGRKRTPKAAPAKPEASGNGEDSKAQNNTGVGSGDGNNSGMRPAPLDQMLVKLLDPKKMNEQEQQAVWTLILYLKKQDGQTA